MSSTVEESARGDVLVWCVRGITYVYVPNALVNIIGSRTVTSLCSISTKGIIPLLCFQVPNASGEETCGNEVQETSRDDKEQLKLGSRTTPSKHVSLWISIHPVAAREKNLLV